MILSEIIKQGLCLGCGTCAGVCPTEAIQIKTLKSEQIKEMIAALAPNN